MGTIDKKEEELVESDELMSSYDQFVYMVGLLLCVIGTCVFIAMAVAFGAGWAIFASLCIIGIACFGYYLLWDLINRVQVLRAELSDIRRHEHDLEVEISFLLPQTDMGRLDYPGRSE